MRAAAAQPLHLRSGLSPLDEALFGGVPAGSVTEARVRPALLCRWAPCLTVRCCVSSYHAAVKLVRQLGGFLLTPRPPVFPACSRPQVVGPAGLGKTQLCLQLCVLGYLERLAEGASVAYIDTENKFSGQRWVLLSSLFCRCVGAYI